MITNEEHESQNIKFFKADKPKHGGFNINKVPVLKPPECVVINLINYPGLELKSLEGMPKNLPYLVVLSIQNLPIKSLKGITKNLPNLESLGFIKLKLKSLNELPKHLPNLKGFGIVNTNPLHSLKGLPSELPLLERVNINNVPLESLQYLPKSLPNLEKFIVIQTNIQTLEFFTSDVPALKEIHLLRNKLVSLKGIPPEIPKLKKIYLGFNHITTLEHLPYKIDRDRRVSIMAQGNSIRTLAGIKFPPFLKKIVGNKYMPLCPTGRKLVKDYNEKVETFDIELPSGEIWHKKLEKDPARYDAIVKFYRKTPMELTQQYIQDPDSLSDDELERLGWEGGYQERKLLESKISLDHPIIVEISQRLSHRLPSGLSILK